MSRIRLQMTPGPCYFLDLDGFYAGLQELLGRMIEARFIEEEQVEAAFVFAQTTEELITLLAERASHPASGASAPVVPEANLPMG